jgi:hypothetical protein
MFKEGPFSHEFLLKPEHEIEIEKAYKVYKETQYQEGLML